MPAREVMKLFHKGKLHSGSGGPIVRNPAQARAIQLSYARKEGHNIPKPDEVRKGGYGKALA